MKFLVIPSTAGPLARVIDIERLVRVAARAGYTIAVRGAAYAWEAHQDAEGGAQLNASNYDEADLLRILRRYLDEVVL